MSLSSMLTGNYCSKTTRETQIKSCFFRCQTASRPPQGTITIKIVTWLITRALLSDRSPYYQSLFCSIRHGHTPLRIDVSFCVCMCLVFTLQ